MRNWLLAAALFAMLAMPALADVTLTGNVKTVGTANVGAKLLVRFELQNCVASGQNIPRVIGVGILNQTYFDYPVDASGNIVAADGGTAKIYGNDQITCDTLGNSWYRVYIIYERDKQFYGDFDVTGGAFNLNSATPRTPGATIYSPVAALTNPAGSQTITQPAGTTLSVNNLNNIGFIISGADPCVGIAAQIAAAPSTGGIVGGIFQGTQGACAASLTINKPITLILGPATFPLGAHQILVTSPGVKIWGMGSAVTTISSSYAGTAIDTATTAGNGNLGLRGFTVLTTNDAANCLKLGNLSRQDDIVDVLCQGTNAATTTGVGLLLDATNGGSSFSGQLSMKNFYSLGYKYPMKVTGGNVNTDTWTSITGDNVWLAGRAAGHISGSIGLWMTAQANMTGSKFSGGAIEANVTGIQGDNGCCIGVDFAMDLEGNDTIYSLPASYSGTLQILNGGGKYSAQANGTSNRWNGELRQNGGWYLDNRNTFAWTIYDDSTNAEEWQFNRGPGKATGGSPTGKFVIHADVSGVSTPGTNYLSWLGHKISHGSVAPGSGTCALGDLVFNTTATAGANIGWMCTSAGSPGTWTAWGSVGPWILASSQFANQGTATTLLHGNAAGNPSWAGVSLANDTAANQGTTVTILHGNASGQPSFAVVTPSDAAGNTSGSGNFARVGSPSFTGTPLFADGTAAAPSLAFASSPSTGFYSPSVNGIAIARAGTATHSFNLGTNGEIEVAALGRYCWSSTTDPTISIDTCISRRAATQILFGTADAAAPQAQTLTFQGSRGGTDSNIAGTSSGIQSSLGTGNGAGAQFYISRALMGASGTTQQAAAHAIVVGESKTLSNTSSTVTTLATIGLANNTAGGVSGTVTVTCSDGTNFDSETQSFNVSYVNKAGTFTVGTPAITVSTAANNSGSCTIGLTVTGASGLISIKVTPVFTTIVPTTVTAYMELHNHGAGAVAFQ